MNHREDKIVGLILPLLYIKDIPHEIVSKYFLRAYTEESFLLWNEQTINEASWKILPNFH